MAKDRKILNIPEHADGKAPKPLQTRDLEAEPREAALRHAWRLYRAYSTAANRIKNKHMRLRTWIIRLIWLASLIAVLAGMPRILQFIETYPRGGMIEQIVQLVLVALPIATAAMFSYSNEFAHPEAWIQYRMAAEKIRREIYLLRTGTSVYAPTTEKGERSESQILTEFLNRIETATGEISYVDSEPPVSKEYDLDSLQKHSLEVAKAKTDTDSDDGYSSLDVNQYIEWRVNPQRNWYAGKVQRDHADLRRWRQITLAGGGAGSVLAALSLEWAPLVAVASATTLAIATYVQLKMFGGTFGNYYTTRARLDMVVTEWSILTEAERKDPKNQSDFVTRIEQIFQDEREIWKQQAIQAQVEAEQALSKSIDKDDKDGDEGSTVTRTSTTTSRRTTASSSSTASATTTDGDSVG